MFVYNYIYMIIYVYYQIITFVCVFVHVFLHLLVQQIHSTTRPVVSTDSDRVEARDPSSVAILRP